METMETDPQYRNLTDSQEDDLALLDEGELYQGDDGKLYQGDQDIVTRKTTSDDADLWTTLKKMLFIIGTTTIIFVALRNSLTYHLQHFWGASGNFWQQQWDRSLNTFGDDPFVLMVYGTAIFTNLVYWTAGGLYTLMDVFNKPAYLQRYKVQPGTNEPVDSYNLLKCIFFVNINLIVVGIPFSMSLYYLMTLRGYDQSPQLPTFGWVLVELIGSILLMEIGFYYSHRLCHHRLFYKRVHKMHHEWQSPISISALYCHPLEHILSNICPAFLGPLVFGSHIATIWFWTSMLHLSTINAHSGYHLPFLPSPEAHDYHHLKFNQCYGILGVLDLLHGTDTKFRQSKAFDRHLMFLSLTPPREVFPDIDPNAKLLKGKNL